MQQHMLPPHIPQQQHPFEDAQQQLFQQRLQQQQQQHPLPPAIRGDAQQHPFEDTQQQHLPPSAIHGDVQQHMQSPFDDAQQQFLNRQRSEFEEWQRQRQSSTSVTDTASMAPPPLSSPLLQSQLL
jgi:hypothetical protein